MSSYRATLNALASAQKGAARGAPAYSRFVNRKLGRYLAAAAIQWKLTPNMVTGISAVFTFTGIALIASFTPHWALSLGIAALLVIGYAFDSADGQVARYTKRGGPSGEWLDHVVDSVKVVTLPLAIGVQWYRFDVVDDRWLIVPLIACIVASVSFLAMILTEQLRRARGVTSQAVNSGPGSWVRPLVALPVDYGVLCLSLICMGTGLIFPVLYLIITGYGLLYLIASLIKWFRELSA